MVKRENCGEQDQGKAVQNCGMTATGPPSDTITSPSSVQSPVGQLQPIMNASPPQANETDQLNL